MSKADTFLCSLALGATAAVLKTPEAVVASALSAAVVDQFKATSTHPVIAEALPKREQFSLV